MPSWLHGRAHVVSVEDLGGYTSVTPKSPWYSRVLITRLLLLVHAVSRGDACRSYLARNLQIRKCITGFETTYVGLSSGYKVGVLVSVFSTASIVPVMTRLSIRRTRDGRTS